MFEKLRETYILFQEKRAVLAKHQILHNFVFVF